jgi:hypothetical protein
MKVILIGEEHIGAQGPCILLEILQELKHQEVACSLGLEIPSLECVDNLYSIGDATKNDWLLAQLQRKLFILGAMELFPAFAADLANKEKERAVRDKIMAAEIFDRDEEVVVMLVGSLHLEGISRQLKTGGIEVLCFAPQSPLAMLLFPSIGQHISSENGFFYNSGCENISQAKQRVCQFVH